MSAETPVREEAAASARRPRRGLAVVAWVVAVVAVVLGALVVTAAGRDETVGVHLRSPLDPSPDGALAVAEVLRDQGVDVRVVHSYWDAEARVGDGTDTTLLVDDDWWVLTPDAYRAIGELPATLVVVQPNDDALAELAPEVSYAGFSGGVVEADCALPAAERAERIDASGDAYTVPDGATGCFPSENDGAGDAAAVVRLDRGDRPVTLLGAFPVLSNAEVAHQGNAALVLGLLGEHERLVWYQPDVDDLSWEPEGSLASRQADWFVPIVVLALLVGIAAAFWRGRRMGPVVVENLPVTVRSSETLEGRARLYERGGARDHALDTLRSATVARLAHAVGLERTASAEEVVLAVAATTRRDPDGIRALLVTARASDDRAFVRLSDELLRLERDVARDLRP